MAFYMNHVKKNEGKGGLADLVGEAGSCKRTVEEEVFWLEVDMARTLI